MKLDKINTQEAFRYLGYGQDMPGEDILLIAEECEKLLLAVIEGRYVYRYFPIVPKENAAGLSKALPMEDKEEFIELAGTDLRFAGRSIAKHLAGCSGAAIFAATLSEGVDRLIRRLQVRRMSAAVIADSLASAAVEQICDMAEQEIMESFPGKYATWRFSPGYGDFPLEVQGRFLEVLAAPKRIGVNITGGGLMTPCKSVTAVIGISDAEVVGERRSCGLCSMRERCSYRRKGGHCGI